MTTYGPGIVLAVAAILTASPALAETSFENCQAQLIIVNCVLNHPDSKQAQEDCVRAGDPSTTPLQRARWCQDHGSPSK